MILAVLQARLNSTRLPGKVLLPLEGEPALARQVERVLRARKIHKLVIATSDQPADDPIASLCEKKGWEYFRGSEADVLGRFHAAAAIHSPHHVMRLTGDNPLAEPALLDELVDFHLSGNFDFSSNGIEPTLPDGLDASIFKHSLLEIANKEAKLPSEREHVTLYFQNQKPRFRIGSYKIGQNLAAHRWTLDEPEDYEFLRKVFAELYPNNKNFTWRDVLELEARKPELSRINSRFARNEGLALSLSREKKT